MWLSPIFPSPMADFGYDVSDYCDVDPVFGTLADVDRLVEQAHARGMRVILDWVPNHTSDRHPWFQASRSARDDPRRDWYVWRAGPAPGAPPNDWTSQFQAVGPAWTFDEATGQWYLHSFMAERPDLNWDNPEVEAAMHDVIRFWLDRGVDGLRLDAIHKIAKDPLLRSHAEAPRRHDEDWETIHPRLRGSAASSTSTRTAWSSARSRCRTSTARSATSSPATSCTWRTTSCSWTCPGTPRPSAPRSTTSTR